jgi:NADH-quinone oxidoreductase subunit C
MIAEQIAEILRGRFGDRIVESNFKGAHPHVVVDAGAWHDMAVFLKSDDRLQFDMLRCISTVDMLEDNQFVVVYDLHSTRGVEHAPENWSARHEFCVKIKLPRDNAHLPTVADVWNAADWHEREAFDLMGVVFDGHPDSVDGPDGPHPRRILCADDWVGYPLRKDYEFPMEYHGIPAVTEYGQTRPVH